MFKSTMIMVTPDLAKQFLNNRRTNRTIKKNQVDKLVRDIKNGDFVTSSQGISFDSQGRLCDGQHRCSAIALAGVSVLMRADWDLTDEQVDVLDRGASRTIEDVLTMKGVKNANRTTAIARNVAGLERRNMATVLSVSSCNDVLDKIGRKYVDEAASYGNRSIISALRAAVALALPIDEDRVRALVNNIKEGKLMVGTEEAIGRSITRVKTEKVNQLQSAEIFCRGMVAILTGENINQIRSDSKGFEQLMALRKKKGLSVSFL